ncbi:MAG: DegT/DnrJ/EryC1/StrS family aminotransferase [Hyphomicrobiaceae bacterium]|nr:DegT/DnrJ/EryC1/StrS family aminotransferase [Hyphomicrobiaceae bacterium]
MTTSLSKMPEPETQPQPLAFIDLAAQQARIRPQLDEAIARVLDHGKYIMGPEVREFEANLAGFCGAEYAISCSSGTDALLMVLMAKDIGPGDAVICPAFTFTATPEVIALLGATPVFADVREDTFNLDPDGLEDAVSAAKEAGLAPKAIVAVDLFGLPADYDAIEKFADDNGLWVLADAAQGFGAVYKNRKVGKFGLATATSFFPAKPLGCYGDGGAILTDDAGLAADLDSIRVHGKGTEKYDNVRIGINGRMDTIQAAVLIEKLKIFTDEIEARDKVATNYSAALAGSNGLSVPVVPDGLTSVWAQYTLRVPSERRDGLAAALKAKGVPTAVYYPKPLHHQTAYRDYPVPAGGLGVSERLATEVLSLPMHPYLDDAMQDHVVKSLIGAL